MGIRESLKTKSKVPIPVEPAFDWKVVFLFRLKIGLAFFCVICLHRANRFLYFFWLRRVEDCLRIDL